MMEAQQLVERNRQELAEAEATQQQERTARMQLKPATFVATLALVALTGVGLRYKLELVVVNLLSDTAPLQV